MSSSGTALQPFGASFIAPWLKTVGLALITGIVLGVAVAAATPLYVVAGLLGIVGAVVLLSDIRVGIYGFIAVATLLPFVVIPVQIGIARFTLVDICLGAVLLLWLLRLLTDRRERIQGSQVDLPILLYLGICVTSFVLGTAYQTTVSDARLFLKFVTSVVFFFALTNCVRNLETLRRLILSFIAGGAVAGVIAIILYYLPAATATRLLASLSRFGYPAADILQYDANTQILKAIGTSIDHNVLGATLMMTGVLAIGVLAARWRWGRKAWILAALGPILVALLLTYSRGSLVGLLAGGAVIATLRYRRLWLLGGLVIAAILVSSQLSESTFINHLETGLYARDQATQMRFGEYKDALRLITEYPWFGVGFGSAPDVDLYLGVSSIYLLIPENIGLIGLSVWVWMNSSIYLRALRQLRGLGARIADEAPTYAVACLGTLSAVLVAGIFDHHFVDIQFPHVVALVWLVIALLMVALRESPIPE